MALSSIAIPPDPERDAKARALVPQVKTWHIVTLKRDHGAFKRGDVFLQTPKGYRCNAVTCECVDYRRGHICKHIRAVAMADAAALTKPAKRIEDLWPTCWEKGCDNDPEPGEKACWRHANVDAF